MDFEAAHKNWYKNLPLKNRIFEMFYAYYINKHFVDNKGANNWIIFENHMRYDTGLSNLRFILRKFALKTQIR